MTREHDIHPLNASTITIHIDEAPVQAMPGETLLGVLAATGRRRLWCHDAGQAMGAYCGMGVCHSCTVRINGKHRQRACQTTVHAGMRVETGASRLRPRVGA